MKKTKAKKTLPLILRQNPLQSLKDWKRGFEELTPLDHSIAKRVAHFWAILGATTAAIALLLQVPYGDETLPTTVKLGFGIFISAIAYLQFVEYRKENQKVKGLESMKGMMEEKHNEK